MRDRIYVAVVVGAVALVAATVLAVLTTGIRRADGFPSLRTEPNRAIRGAIAYLRNDGCLVVAMASGASATQSVCVPPYSVSAVAFVDKDTVALAMQATGLPLPSPTPSSMTTPTPVPPPKLQQWVLIDLRDGQLRPTGVPVAGVELPSPFNGVVSPDGRFAWVDPADAKLYVSEPQGRRLLLRLAKDEPFMLNGWSPDGQWLLGVQFRGSRSYLLIIVDVETGSAAELADDAAPVLASWWVDGLGAWPRLPEVEGLAR